MPITLTASDPTPNLRPLQRYLDQVRYPRNRTDCRGTSVGVRVIDGGWRLDHEALHRPCSPPNQNGVREMDIDHGTAVLGILAGMFSIQGLCPFANFDLRLWFTLQDELRQASEQMRHGDVLLIERDLSLGPYSGVPVEYSEDLQPAIISCVQRGIIPIIPVGNTNTDLDKEKEIPHSGAIWVAGAHVWPDGRLAPTPETSYGTRVDVCAPARGGLTCGPSDYIDGPDVNRHYGIFDGTSMASAIVAGACAGINSALLAAGKPMLDVRGMRDLLVSTGRDTTTEKNVIPIGKFLDITRALQEKVPGPDFDMDGSVGWSDFFEFARCWNANDPRGDFDGDGAVTWRDFNVLRGRWMS